jgi:hypothetical protein
VQLTIYGITQQALRNVMTHSKASRFVQFTMEKAHSLPVACPPQFVPMTPSWYMHSISDNINSIDGSPLIFEVLS